MTGLIETVVDGKVRLTGGRDKITGEDISYTQTSEITTRTQCDGVIYKWYPKKSIPVKLDPCTLTPQKFGCVDNKALYSNSASDSTTQLQRFFNAVAANPEYLVDWTARVNIRAKINIPDLLNKQIMGHLQIIVPSDAQINDTVIYVNIADKCYFDMISIIAGGSGYGAVASRRAFEGIVIKGGSRAIFNKIFVQGVKFYAVVANSVTGANNNGIIYNFQTYIDCGANFNTSYNTNKVYAETSRSYTANSTTQRSIVSIDLDDSGFDRPYYDNIGIAKLDNGDVHAVMSYNSVTKTAELYPCLRAAGQSGTMMVHKGGGLLTRGGDAGEYRITNMFATRCGAAYFGRSLYGGTLQGLVTQGCGIGICIGNPPNSAGPISDQLMQPYFETNQFDYISLSSAGLTSMYDPIALSLDKCRKLLPLSGSQLDPSPVSVKDRLIINGLVGNSVNFNGSDKPILSIDSDGTAGRGYGTINAFDVANRTRTINLNNDSAKNILYGNIAFIQPIYNCKVGDKIVVNPPAGETINGKSMITLTKLPEKFTLLCSKWNATDWRVVIQKMYNVDSYDETNATKPGISDLWIYTSITAATANLVPGSVHEFIEFNRSGNGASTIKSDATTSVGTLKTLRNNTSFNWTISLDPNVLVNGVNSSFVLASGEEVKLISSSTDTWRIVARKISTDVKYNLKTGNTNIAPGNQSQFFECNTTVVLNQTLMADPTTMPGTILEFRNNGVNSLSITPDVGVTIAGTSNVVVLPNKDDYIKIIASAASVWRIITKKIKAGASSNSATAAAGSAPTKAEFDALLNDVKDLRAKIVAAEGMV